MKKINIKKADIFKIGPLLVWVGDRWGKTAQLLAALVLALALIAATLFGVVTVSGCSTIKQRNILNALENGTGRVADVCNTVDYFEAVGVAVPGSAGCIEIMKVIDSEEYKTIYDVASCGKRYDDDSKKFIKCVAAVDGWKSLAKRIAGQ